MIISIKKLFGKKDITVDLSKKMNIIIGENGSGKSTILKIIYYFSKRDFISLSKILFDSITIENDGVSETIYYNDLQPITNSNKPGFDLILKNFCDSYNYINNMNFIDNSIDYCMMDDFNSFYNGLLEKMNLLNKFVDNKIDNRYNFNYYNKKDNELYFGKEYKEYHQYGLLQSYFNNIQSHNKFVYGSKLYIFNIFYFYKTYYTEKYLIEKHEYKSKWLFFKDIIADDGNPYRNIYVDKKYLDNYYLTNFDSFDFFADCIYDNYVNFYDSEVYKNKVFNETTINTLIGKLNDLLMDIENIRNINHIFMSDIRSNEKVKKVLNMIKANTNVFFEKTLNKFGDSKNQKLYEEYVERLRPRQKFGEKNLLEEDPYDLEYKENHKHKLIEPFSCLIDICNEVNKLDINPFDEHEEVIEGYYYYGDTICPYNIIALYNYINDNYDQIINLRDTKSHHVFVKLTNKYIKGKNIDYYYDELGKIKLEIFDKVTNNKINEYQMSSGEQKILRLIKLISFKSENSILLLDEPELSLSIYWQEMLLKDIEENSNFSKIIVATQSPNLINEDKIDYLIEIKKEV